MTPVDESYEMTEAPLSEVELILLLKMVNLPEVRQPNVDALAVIQVSASLVTLSPAPVISEK
jgi:hypothetical protein